MKLSKVVLSVHSTLIKVDRLGTRTLEEPEWSLTLDETSGVVHAEGKDLRCSFAPGAWLEAVRLPPAAPVVPTKGKR